MVTSVIRFVGSKLVCLDYLSVIILKVFDLKGSMRSRYVQPGKETAGESEVYLDENFLECV